MDYLPRMNCVLHVLEMLISDAIFIEDFDKELLGSKEHMREVSFMHTSVLLALGSLYQTTRGTPSSQSFRTRHYIQ